MFSFEALPLPLATVALWYALPLVVSVSLVCAATRHELLQPILHHSLRFAGWLLAFMAAVMALLAILERLA